METGKINRKPNKRRDNEPPQKVTWSEDDVLLPWEEAIERQEKRKSRTRKK